GGDTHAVERQAVNAGLGGYIFKFPLPQIPIERVANRRGALSLRGLAAVDEENVQKSVAVEIEEAHAAARGLDQKAVGRGAAEMFPGDPGRLRHFGENLSLGALGLPPGGSPHQAGHRPRARHSGGEFSQETSSSCFAAAHVKGAAWPWRR